MTYPTLQSHSLKVCIAFYAVVVIATIKGLLATSPKDILYTLLSPIAGVILVALAGVIFCALSFIPYFLISQAMTGY